MRYTPCWKQIGISLDRYLELVHFCRQYPEWIVDPLPGTETLKKIAIVEKCAISIGNGEWYAAMIEHVCYKKTQNKIDIALLPNSDRNVFYRQRRLFFELLNQNTV